MFGCFVAVVAARSIAAKIVVAVAVVAKEVVEEIVVAVKVNFLVVVFEWIVLFLSLFLAVVAVAPKFAAGENFVGQFAFVAIVAVVANENFDFVEGKDYFETCFEVETKNCFVGLKNNLENYCSNHLSCLSCLEANLQL